LRADARFHTALRQIPGRHQLPPALSWRQVEDFLDQSGAAPSSGVSIREATSF
jgi:hypothetical protein